MSPRLLKAGAALLLATAALTGCERRADVGTVVVSAIGPRPSLAATAPDGTAGRLLRDAVAQGLVRFDAAGQIEPGLASRWIVIDGGRSYIFRIGNAAWPDGSPVTAEQVAAILTRALDPRSHNPLRPFLSAIDEVVTMTPQVIEVRLKRQRPDLLKLFAQPELAVFRLRPAPGGSGPFRIAEASGDALLLQPAADPDRDPDDPAAPADVRQQVRLIGEPAARAIVRFVRRDSDLVTGGTFADWPLVPLARVAPANIRTDPAAGLFGLAVTSRDGFLGDAANRAAVARAIDRSAITQAYASGWGSTDTILPDTLDSAAPPAPPVWSTPRTPREIVAEWQRNHPQTPATVRIALPEGPGATLLFGLIAGDLQEIGVTATRVGAEDPADLRLIDAVAPYDSARWYLAVACQPCSAPASDALVQARDAPTMAARAQWIAEADRLLAADVSFIPIARPLRWSLVALRLRQWQLNPRAWHPLNHLRGDPT